MNSKKRFLTLVLLALFAVGGIAATSWYFQQSITATGLYSINSVSNTEINCGQIHESETKQCSSFTIVNDGSTTKTLKLVIDNKNPETMLCTVPDLNGETFTLAPSIMASFDVIATARGMPNFEPGTANCTVSVEPA